MSYLNPFLFCGEGAFTTGNLLVATIAKTMIYGGPCWIRTSDQLVKSQLLYQLS